MQTQDFHWDDLKVAWLVAETGNLTRAADQAGLTHSTVLRRIGRLEEALGTKLFIRHQRGYQLTDAGRLMHKSMRPIADDIHRLYSGLNILEQEPSGTLRVSTVSDFSQVFAPVFHAFRDRYSRIRIQVVATDERVALSSGDVHVAIRIGEQPTEPDLVARKITQIHLRYYAADSYIKRFGVPTSINEVNDHQWVIPSGKKQSLPGIKQLADTLNQDQIVFQSNSFSDVYSAIREGMGIGPVDGLLNWSDNINRLKEVDFGMNMHSAVIWFVYHKDMRGSARIRALQDFMLGNMPHMLKRSG